MFGMMFEWAIAADEAVRQIEVARQNAAEAQRQADMEIETFRSRQHAGTTIDGTCEELPSVLTIEAQRS